MCIHTVCGHGCGITVVTVNFQGHQVYYASKCRRSCIGVLLLLVQSTSSSPEKQCWQVPQSLPKCVRCFVTNYLDGVALQVHPPLTRRNQVYNVATAGLLRTWVLAPVRK